MKCVDLVNEVSLERCKLAVRTAEISRTGMKGSMFKAAPKHRQHLKDDYRDPELPPLPPVFLHPYRRDVCSSVGSLSMNNVLSDPFLIDHLDMVRFDAKKRVIQDVDYIKSQKEAILKKANEDREKKNKRLQLRDIEQAMTALNAEGFKLTHEIMLMFIHRDTAMLQALKSVQQPVYTSRSTLRTQRDGRLVLASLKQWEQALKDGDKGKAASTLLYLSLHFQNKEDPTYYWLVYELYHLAVKSCRGCKGNITEAVIQYLFGKFLLEKAKHYKEAEFHLERACSLSYGYNWTTAFLSKDSNDHIHDCSNYLLHILLIKRGADCSYKHPLRAIKLVRKAVRVISRANNGGALADAHFDLAVMYNRAHMPDRAILTLRKAMELYEKVSDQKNICIALLLKAHCLRRMQDYQEAFNTLKMVVLRAQGPPQLPSLQAKGYKHMAEYFIGKNKYQSANVYLKRSYDLFVKCDLRDELDEVSTLYSYTKAWLRIHDVYYILTKIMSKGKEEIFDFPTFVELGIPFSNHLFQLKFVYKMKGRFSPESPKREPAPEGSPSLQRQTLENAVVASDNSKPSLECLKTPSDESVQGEDEKKPHSKDYVVPEYFAFSDLAGLIFDEELNQATVLFERMKINPSSEIAVRTLINVPMQHRESKKSLANLVAMEIADAQKLNCLSHKMYELSILVDKTQVERKMMLVNQRLQEKDEEDYEKQNENELWKFTVELLPWEPLDVYNCWKHKANPIARKYDYNYDIKPKVYKKLLEELLSLLHVYRCYEKYLTTDKLPAATDVSDSRPEPDLGGLKSITVESMPQRNEPTTKETEKEVSKQVKICRCKDPPRRSYS